MGVLSTFLTSQRTALAASPASLNNVPASVAFEDLPVSIQHQSFVLKVVGVPSLRAMHGGGVAEYETDIELSISWDPELDPEAIHNTIADDIENATLVMLKTGNRTSGIQLVTPTGGAVDDTSTDLVTATMTYSVIFRVTQDLT